MWLAVAYLAVAAVVVAITAAFLGLLGLALSVLGAVSCFVLAVVFLRDTFLGLAREHYEEEVGTWRRVAAIALLGLVFPLLVVVNSWVFAIVFTNGTALVCGSFGGAVFASAAGALAARYMVSSRALRPEVQATTGAG